MGEKDFESWLYSVMELARDEDMDNSAASIKTFEQVGLLTRNNGLVVKMDDGSEFQITIVKSR